MSQLNLWSHSWLSQFEPTHHLKDCGTPYKRVGIVKFICPPYLDQLVHDETRLVLLENAEGELVACVQDTFDEELVPVEENADVV